MRIVLLSCFLIFSLFAHKLNVFVAQEKQNVIASAFFASGSFCKDCKIEVFNEKNELIESSRTDKNGEYIIKNPISKIQVRVEAIGGHAVKNEFELNDLKEKKESKEQSNILQTFIAAFLIGLIFLVLKRVKR